MEIIREWWRQYTTSHKIVIISIVINTGVLVVYGIMMLQNRSLVSNSQEQTKQTKRQFIITNRAQLEIRESCLYRHWWRVHNRNTIQLVYKIFNLTNNAVQVDSVKHKWDFDSADYAKYFLPDYIDTINYHVDFNEIDKLVTVNRSAVKQMWTTQKDYAGFSIYRDSFNQDSMHLINDSNLLFIEVYYTNVYTDEKGRFMFIGKINGKEPFDEWKPIKQIFYNKTEFPNEK